VRHFLGGLFGEAVPHLVYECRRCGEPVTRETAECPACEHGEISTHDVR